MRRTAVISMMLAIAIVVLGGLPGRRIERDTARCWKEHMLAGPLGKVTPAMCEPSYVTHELPASGPELRILAGFLALCALLAAMGPAGIAATLIITLGLAGVVITFVTTRTFDSPFRETTELWPHYAVLACTAGLALSIIALLVMYVRRVMKV